MNEDHSRSRGWDGYFPNHLTTVRMACSLPTMLIVEDSLSDVPQVKHDADFIKHQVDALPADELSSFNPIRTNTYLQFFEHNSEHSAEKPYVCKIPPPTSSQTQINFGGCYRKVMITDVRGRESIFKLDKHGFQFATRRLDHQGPVLDIESYCCQMAAWLKEYLDAKDVFVFDRTLRTADKLKSSEFVDIARRVHCGMSHRESFHSADFNITERDADQSPRSAVGRIKLHMGTNAVHLLRGRCRIIK